MKRISKVKVLPNIGWSWNLTTAYPELWTSLKRSARVYSPYGATRLSSSRFVSVHPANWFGANRWTYARMRSTSR